MINGIIVYALLFWTDQWQSLVPTTWEVFPNAASTALQYLSLNFPVEESWTRYNSLQRLTYFITVFVAAPSAPHDPAKRLHIRKAPPLPRHARAHFIF
jgi:sulfoxide reductase catalytic subunit YedY